MAGAVSVHLERQSGMQSWGFRLQGGLDFRLPLSIKKVSPGTPAQGKLAAGDAILAIGRYDASQMTHMQASQLIQNAGNVLQMTVTKGYSQSLRPKGPVKFSPGTAFQYNR